MALLPVGFFETLEFLVLFILIIYTVGASFLAVSVKSLYHAVLWLIFTLLGIAMIFLLYAESALLLVVQLVVYAGGITVLMLFAISLSGKLAMFEQPKDWKLLDRRLSFAGAFILFVVAYYILTQVSSTFWGLQDLTNKPEEAVLIENLAVNLFTTYGGIIIVLGLLLLAAMLGSVYLVKKELSQTKEVNDL
ncbi:MAG: NADH-quinone oxidoreductase subunit J [Candidatus Heimdallarchaeota archaeon]